MPRPRNPLTRAADTSRPPIRLAPWRNPLDFDGILVALVDEEHAPLAETETPQPTVLTPQSPDVASARVDVPLDAANDAGACLRIESLEVTPRPRRERSGQRSIPRSCLSSAKVYVLRPAARSVSQSSRRRRSSSLSASSSSGADIKCSTVSGRGFPGVALRRCDPLDKASSSRGIAGLLRECHPESNRRRDPIKALHQNKPTHLEAGGQPPRPSVSETSSCINSHGGWASAALRRRATHGRCRRPFGRSASSDQAYPVQLKEQCQRKVQAPGRSARYLPGCSSAPSASSSASVTGAASRLPRPRLTTASGVCPR